MFRHVRDGTIFDSGVPFVQLPCTPVVTHLTTTVPELAAHVKGQGAIGDYLYEIFSSFQEDHFAWSRVLWDVTAVAWLVNNEWLPSRLVPAPSPTDQYTLSFDDSRHQMRVVYFVERDPIFRDFFTKLKENARK